MYLVQWMAGLRRCLVSDLFQLKLSLPLPLLTLKRECLSVPNWPIGSSVPQMMFYNLGIVALGFFYPTVNHRWQVKSCVNLTWLEPIKPSSKRGVTLFIGVHWLTQSRVICNNTTPIG